MNPHVLVAPGFIPHYTLNSPDWNLIVTARYFTLFSMSDHVLVVCHSVYNSNDSVLFLKILGEVFSCLLYTSDAADE